jgi:succinate dehydrogenase/fumarate reductase flavoprotein subunit
MTGTHQRESAKTYDVIVVGTGAAGLTTAVTAKLAGLEVAILEKTGSIGGTTAQSGGGLWVPCNPRQQQAGISDSRDRAEQYLRACAGNFYDGARMDAFLDTAPEMIRFLEANTTIEFQISAKYADYHHTFPGALDGGRTIFPDVFNGRKLGADLQRIDPPLPEFTFAGMQIGSGRELQHFLDAMRSPRSLAFVGARLARYAADMLLYRRAARLTNGQALIGHLLFAARRLNIPILLNAPVEDLVWSGDTVSGVKAIVAGRQMEMAGRVGIVLACGGFPQDIARRARTHAHATTGAGHWSAAPAANSGDGVRIAERNGAALALDYPNPVAFATVSLAPRRNGSVGVVPHFMDRAKPGRIMVTRRGKRFTNEADSYHHVSQAMIKACSGDDEIAAFLISDHDALRRYGMGAIKPAPIPFGFYARTGYLISAPTLGELAEKCGVDPAAFKATVTEYNRAAASGRDPQFHRGECAYNRFNGDPDHHPNPCVGPIVTPPFHAIKILIGDLGTFMGIRTDASARVLGTGGSPIDGLYAVGNDAASVFGGDYPGGGSTLGPGMTFAYIAGNALAARKNL